jgi:hypothetical protein
MRIDDIRIEKDEWRRMLVLVVARPICSESTMSSSFVGSEEDVCSACVDDHILRELGSVKYSQKCTFTLSSLIDFQFIAIALMWTSLISRLLDLTQHKLWYMKKEEEEGEREMRRTEHFSQTIKPQLQNQQKKSQFVWCFRHQER